MHSLLKRQLRKYLSSDLEKHPDMASFLAAIDKSYENHDEKLTMLHRASKLSSDELYDANRKLQAEALQQKNIFLSLFVLHGVIISLGKAANNNTSTNNNENSKK